MFTGLIEEKGTILSLTRQTDIILLEVKAPGISSELKLGESVAVSGACLTVVRTGRDMFAVEMIPETAERTKHGTFRSGCRVNLERALLAGGRLDGHIVTGHVDSLGAVLEMKRLGRSFSLRIQADPQVLTEIAPKGSVTLDGVSLTVIDAGKDVFSVGLIPTTLDWTTLGELKPGDPINIETDVLAKYVRRLLSFESRSEPEEKRGIDWKTLNELGWV